MPEPEVMSPASALTKIMVNMRGTVVPDAFPVKQSNTSDILSQAVEFVASGKPVSKEFVENLRRMLTSAEERTEVINIIFQHHQMYRLQKLHSAIEQAEAIMFNPETLQNLDADQMLRLLQLTYSESASVQKSLQTDIQIADNVADAVDPAKLESAELARKKVGDMPMKVRKMVREQLLKVLPVQ